MFHYVIQNVDLNNVPAFIRKANHNSQSSYVKILRGKRKIGNNVEKCKAKEQKKKKKTSDMSQIM